MTKKHADAAWQSWYSSRRMRSWKRAAQHHKLRDPPRPEPAKAKAAESSDIWIHYKNMFGVSVYMAPDRTLHWSPPCHSSLRSATVAEQDHVNEKCRNEKWFWYRGD